MSNIKGVDAHCHLDFEQFDKDRREVVQKSRDSLDFVVVPGVNYSHNKLSHKLEDQYPDFIVSNMGLHPTYTEDFESIKRIKEQIIDHNPRAIGEIGLDYHHVTEKNLRDKQRKILRQMLELAEELDKPVVLHTRDAEKDVLNILETYDLDKIFLHCFNGSVDLAKKACERGIFIGITTQVLYSKRVKEIASQISLEKMLLETDGPYLYPDDRNEPENVIESAERISKLRDIPKKTILEKTTSNAQNFFLNE